MRPLSVGLMLIDGITAIRDADGRAVAHEVSAEVQARLLECIRAVDMPGRLGPAQIGLMLPETPISTAVDVFERIRATIAAEPALTAAGPRGTALSVGVAAVTPRLRDPRNLLMAASLELRRARNAGGDCVHAVPAEMMVVSTPRNGGVH